MVNAMLLRLWGVAVAFGGTALCIASIFEWLFKFRRNMRPNKLFYLILMDIFGSVSLTILAVRLLAFLPGGVTFACAIISGLALQIIQATLWRCCLQRLHSVLGEKKFGTKMAFWASMLTTGICMVPVGFLLYGAYESKGNVLVLIGSKWFEKFFRGWDGIDIAIYAVVSTIADTILLQTLKSNMRKTNRTTSSKTMKLRIQSTLVILNLALKMTDCSIKLASLVTEYFPFDTYFRSFSVCFETWTLLKLGVTIEDVLSADGFDKSSEGSTTATQLLGRGDTVKRNAETHSSQNSRRDLRENKLEEREAALRESYLREASRQQLWEANMREAAAHTGGYQGGNIHAPVIAPPRRDESLIAGMPRVGPYEGYSYDNA